MGNEDKKDKELPQLLTLREACYALKCHPNTLRNWDKSGVLVAVRFGPRGDRRYKKEDIVKMISKK